MNKLTKLINFDIGNNSERNIMNSNFVCNGKQKNRKVSVNSVNSPNMSSISSADSVPVTMKIKTSKQKNFPYPEIKAKERLPLQKVSTD